MEPGVKRGAERGETGTAVPVFEPKRMPAYSKREVREKLPLYREFLLKYLLTYGVEPSVGFFRSPLWNEYTNHITFVHVLDAFNHDDNLISKETYFAIRPDALDFVTGEDCG